MAAAGAQILHEEGIERLRLEAVRDERASDKREVLQTRDAVTCAAHVAQLQAGASRFGYESAPGARYKRRRSVRWALRRPLLMACPRSRRSPCAACSQR